MPEAVKLDMLLGELRARGYQMAIVVDEYGGTAGRRDPRGPRGGARRRGRRRARPHAARASCAAGASVSFPGILRPDELLDRTGIRVPEDGVYETVGGYIMASSGASRSSATRSPIEDGTLEVQRLDGRRVDRVRFTPRRCRCRTTAATDGVSGDERLGRNRRGCSCCSPQRLLRRRRVRRHLRAPLADRAARRAGRRAARRRRCRRWSTRRSCSPRASSASRSARC